MKKSQKLALRASEIRSRLGEIAELEGEAITDEIKTEQRGLESEYKELDNRLRAALISESEEPEQRSEGDGEGAELRSLIGRSNVGEVFAAITTGRDPDGATGELQKHFKLRGNQVPLELLAGNAEARAVTPAPSNTQANQAEIVPGVFPVPAADFLGIPRPVVMVGDAVFPVLVTNATAHTPAEGAAAAETTGSFSADVLTPKRIQASFFYSREDAARFGGMGEALRMNLSEALGDGLDKEIIAGANGLLTGTNLANNNHGNAATTYAEAVQGLMYGRVDGRYAAMTSDVRVLLGTASFSYLGALFAESTALSALAAIRDESSGIRVSAHMPAIASNKQNALIRLGNRQDMQVPVWQGVELIEDRVTKAASGELVITAVMLHAVKITRAAGFHKREIRVAA